MRGHPSPSPQESLALLQRGGSCLPLAARARQWSYFGFVWCGFRAHDAQRCLGITDLMQNEDVCDA